MMPLNFEGLKKKLPSPELELTFPCIKCLAHGCWNIGFNFFGEGKHLKEICCQCEGVGYLGPNSFDIKCVHEFKKVTTSQFLFAYNCKHCNKVVAGKPSPIKKKSDQT